MIIKQQEYNQSENIFRKFDENDMNLFPYNKNLIKFLEEEDPKKSNIKKKCEVTMVSKDFWNKIEKFDWAKNDKDRFIAEMIALTPSKRMVIIDNMIESEKSNI